MRLIEVSQQSWKKKAESCFDLLRVTKGQWYAVGIQQLVPREYHLIFDLLHGDHDHRRIEHLPNRLDVAFAVLFFCHKIQYKYAVRIENPFCVFHKFAFHYRSSDSELIVGINQHYVGTL